MPQKLVALMKEFILEILSDFGLTDKESEVYIYLAKCPRNREDKFGN